MNNSSILFRGVVALLVAAALLFAGASIFAHEDHCESDAGCDDCVTQCACHSSLAQECAAVAPALHLALLGHAFHDVPGLASGIAGAIFIPPRS